MSANSQIDYLYERLHAAEKRISDAIALAERLHIETHHAALEMRWLMIEIDKMRGNQRLMGLGETSFDTINETVAGNHFRLFQSLCWQISEDHDFHKPKLREDGIVRDASPVERMMLMVSEVSEAMEAYRRNHKAGDIYLEADGKPEGVAVEIADTVIRCFDYAELYGFDLFEVMMLKCRYNDKRPILHGNKHL